MSDPIWRAEVERQLLADRIAIAENTAITLETKQGVDEIVGILKAAKGAIKVLGWVAAIAKWVGIIAVAASALWALWYQATHGGDLPHK